MDSTTKDTDKKVLQEQDIENQIHSETSSLGNGDILQLEHTDPILNSKMHLVNNAM
jgi:hypothetical protein